MMEGMGFCERKGKRKKGAVEAKGSVYLNLESLQGIELESYLK